MIHSTITTSTTTITSLQILDVLLVKISPPHILIGTSVSALSGWNTVTFSPKIHTEARGNLFSLNWLLPSLNLLTWLIEVLSRVVGGPERRAIKIIEHQVHVFSLLVL